jgi:hypothetical protein
LVTREELGARFVAARCSHRYRIVARYVERSHLDGIESSGFRLDDQRFGSRRTSRCIDVGELFPIRQKDGDDDVDAALIDGADENVIGVERDHVAMDFTNAKLALDGCSDRQPRCAGGRLPRRRPTSGRTARERQTGDTHDGMHE